MSVKQSISDSVNRFIEVAEKFLNVVEGTPQHSVILALYNANKPANEYTMGKTDPWCAAYVGAVSAGAGVVEAIPLSASCDRLEAGIKSLGGYYVDVPQMGDIVFYDYDNNGMKDHVGIVEMVSGNNVMTIEGNYGDKVSHRQYDYRTLNIRIMRPKWSNITKDGGGKVESVSTGVSWDKYRSFYAELPVDWKPLVKTLPLLYKSSYGPYVSILQHLLDIPVDGEFGEKTEAEVKLYQAKKQLEVDGQVGKQTWSSFFV